MLSRIKTSPDEVVTVVQQLLPFTAHVEAQALRGTSTLSGACRSSRELEFRTGRMLAATTLSRAGSSRLDVPRGQRGMPLWPAGFAGSITHTSGMCVAAVAPSSNVSSLGIDLEQADGVEADLANLICTPSEQSRLDEFPLANHFSAKEALFKCQYPLTFAEAEFADVELLWDPGGHFRPRVREARLRLAEQCRGRVGRIGPYVIAAAWLEPGFDIRSTPLPSAYEKQGGVG
jgi:4'-phosphopantetheinyl transferase EntD